MSAFRALTDALKIIEADIGHLGGARVGLGQPGERVSVGRHWSPWRGGDWPGQSCGSRDDRAESNPMGESGLT